MGSERSTAACPEIHEEIHAPINYPRIRLPQEFLDEDVDPFAPIPSEEVHNIVYRIFYGSELVYVGRTTQPVQDRMFEHFHKQPNERVIDIRKVSDIDFTELKTRADMYIYEVYYINRYHPRLNTDAMASDSPTVALPDVDWRKFVTYLWDEWKRDADEIDRLYAQKEKSRQQRRNTTRRKNFEERDS